MFHDLKNSSALTLLLILLSVWVAENIVKVPEYLSKKVDQIVIFAADNCCDSHISHK